MRNRVLVMNAERLIGSALSVILLTGPAGTGYVGGGGRDRTAPTSPDAGAHRGANPARGGRNG